MKVIKCITTNLVLLVFVILMVSCSEPDIEGYILEIEDQRLLVAEDISLGKYEEIKDKTVNKIDRVSEHISLIYLSYDGANNFDEGDNVKVWVDGGVDQSFPAQARAKKIVSNE